MVVIESILLIKYNICDEPNIIDAVFRGCSKKDEYDIVFNIKNMEYLKDGHNALTIDNKYYIYFLHNTIGCITIIKDSISIDELKNININLEALYRQFMKDIGSQWNIIPANFTTHYMPLHTFIDMSIKPIKRLEQTVEATKKLIKETIVGLLDRGEKISELQNKSESIVLKSKTFYKNTQRINARPYIQYCIIGLFIIMIFFSIYEIKLILQDKYV